MASSECGANALVISSWDNIFGPSVELVWQFSPDGGSLNLCSSSSHGAYAMVARSSLDGEMLSDAPDSLSMALSPRFKLVLLRAKQVIVHSILFRVGSSSTSSAILCVSILFPLALLQDVMRCKPIIEDRLAVLALHTSASFVANDELSAAALESTVLRILHNLFMVFRVSSHSANHIGQLSSDPSADSSTGVFLGDDIGVKSQLNEADATAVTAEAKQRIRMHGLSFDFMSAAITSMLQSFSYAVIIGHPNDARLIQSVMRTLSFFLTVDQRMLCRVLNASQNTFVPGLYLQAIVTDDGAQLCAELQSRAPEHTRPFTVVDVTAQTVCLPAQRRC